MVYKLKQLQTSEAVKDIRERDKSSSHVELVDNEEPEEKHQMHNNRNDRESDIVLFLLGESISFYQKAWNYFLFSVEIECLTVWGGGERAEFKGDVTDYTVQWSRS